MVVNSDVLLVAETTVTSCDFPGFDVIRVDPGTGLHEITRDIQDGKNW